MPLYCGIDLHSNNLMAAIMDETGKRILKKETHQRSSNCSSHVGTVPYRDCWDGGRIHL